MTPEVDLAEPVDPDFDYPTSIQVPIQALEETWYRPAFSEVPTKFSTSLQLATATSLPIEHAPIESESRFSHPISLTFGYEKFFSSKYGTFASTQEESHFNSRRSLLVTGTSRPSLRLRIHEYSSPFSKLIYIRSRTLIKSRDLNRSEQNNLLYENKQTQKILSTPNVISMSYTHEVRNGQRTGRKVLQVGVIKKLKKDEIHHPDICIPKEIELSNDLVVPVQVVAEGKLTLHGKYKGGAQLTLAESEPGTLGARVEANGSCRLWSCAHILTNFKEDAIGSEIYVAHHREYDIDNMEYKYEPSYTSKWRIGGHLKIEKESSQTIVYQDIAWATVSEADLSEEIFGIGPVRIRAMPKVGQTVTIRGGYSGYVRHGTICNTNAPLDDTEKNLKFCKMCYINANLRLKKGDSGSAVVHEFKGTKYLVGIYMGTTDIRTYFSAAVLPDLEDCKRHVHDLLCSFPNYQITLDRFEEEYEKMYGSKMDYDDYSNLTSLLESFSSTLTISEDRGPSRLVQLKPIHILTHELTLLLSDHGGQMAIDQIFPKYREKFGRMLLFEFSGLIQALEAIPDTIALVGDLAILKNTVLPF